MSSIPGQIASELGETAKRTGTETAKVPVDVVGRALESLAGGNPKAPQPANVAAEPEVNQATPGEKTPFEKFIETDDEKIKKAIARAALRQLAGLKGKSREPTVQERLQTLDQAQQEKAAKQAALAAGMAPVAPPKGKRRGDLYGIKGKQSSEISRNVRQD